MSVSKKKNSRWMQTISAIGLAAVVAANTGCQTPIGSQTLPSPFYTTDDVQFFAPGPEFKLSREAAAMKQLKAEQNLPPQGP